MKQREKAGNALTAVFPHPKSVVDFIADSQSRNRLQSFVEFAARHHLIDAPTAEAFKTFINENSRPQDNEILDDLTIEELIDNKREYLNIRNSNSALIDKINRLLSKNSINLPPLSGAMFTRLKKHPADTPHRRDALRSFAFWIGYERSDMGTQWHYETLDKLCRNNDSRTNDASCGIRIAFSINSRGNIIGKDIVTWMKRAIRETLNARSGMFPCGQSPRLKNYDLMTIQVDLPNSDSSNIPSAYAVALKEAVTIAHQVSIRWLMSVYSNCNCFFSIGLAAGDFEKINNQLQVVLAAKLPQDPLIRLTDYARQCVMISQIKIIMNHLPKEIESVNGETVKVWWFTELSGMIYWDLVPGIIGENFSAKNFSDPSDIRHQLITPDGANFWRNNDAINCFLKFPHHSMLGVEIVRAVICKNEISEALEILNALLRVTPHHLNSRVMRMVLYKFLGVEAPNYYFSDMMFKMAEKEADYIFENFNQIGEDFYYEYTLLKLARFSTGIKHLRNYDTDSIAMMDCRLSEPDLIKLVTQAEEIIMQGIIVSSPTMERILYLYFAVQALKCVLFESIKRDGWLNTRLAGSNDKIEQHMFSVFLSRYQQKLSLGKSNLEYLQQITRVAVQYDDNMIALEVFRPAQYFNRAVFYWDLLPARNVAIITETLKLLNNAIKSAEACARKENYLYSTANLSGQFVPEEQFIWQMESVIEEIEKRFQKAAELEKMDPAAVIGPADDDLVLMTYHV